MTEVHTGRYDDPMAFGERGGLIHVSRPLRWGAIFGGMAVALGVQFILTLAGVGLGFAMHDSMSDSQSAHRIGMGAIAWLIGSGIISFGLGGWVAGRTSDDLRHATGIMHGVVAWAAAAALGGALAVLAGSPIVGGSAAGLGAAANSGASSSFSTMGSRLTMPDGSVRIADANGRPMSEEQVRTAADEARRMAAQAALWTAAAFLLSMGAAALGGWASRLHSEELFHGASTNRAGGKVRVA